MMKSKVLIILVGICMGPCAMASRLPLRMIASLQNAEPNKKELLSRLKALQDRQIQNANALEQTIQKRLLESQQLGSGETNLHLIATRTDRIATEIDELTKRRNEALAQREVFDRLIFTIDSKWSGQPLKPFLEHAFLDMASFDLKGESSDVPGAHIWKTLTYLSICVREVPEPREDVIDVIEGYLNFSGAMSPKTPAEFLASRAYTNGTESVAAKAISREHAGDQIIVAPGIKTEIRASLQPTISSAINKAQSEK